MEKTQLSYLESVERMARAFSDATAARDPEAALRTIGVAACEALGDRSAASRPGALKPGETDFTISGYFVLRPGGEDMLLVAETGWPAEQHRLVIEIGEGKPGWVLANKTPLLLPNTDEEPAFTQILSSARMGSSMYAPLLWRGSALGLITVASQARHTYRVIDLPLVEMAAAHAASLWVAMGGAQYLAGLEAGELLARDRGQTS